MQDISFTILNLMYWAVAGIVAGIINGAVQLIFWVRPAIFPDSLNLIDKSSQQFLKTKPGEPDLVTGFRNHLVISIVFVIIFGILSLVLLPNTADLTVFIMTGLLYGVIYWVFVVLIQGMMINSWELNSKMDIPITLSVFLVYGIVLTSVFYFLIQQFPL